MLCRHKRMKTVRRQVKNRSENRLGSKDIGIINRYKNEY